jgi:site-specific recombinase XerD
VRISAPHRGFTGAAAICDVVRRALARAGIDPPFKGSHMPRHSLATEMLRCGASLEDIGQILRHRHLETTQIYAKVDLESLRALAQPWPGGAT